LPDIDKNIRRYGFHGISYQYIAKVLPDYIGEKAYGKVVVAHLGHGASMCALNNLKSIATTMGFTALDGLPMGTRCGTIDPGVILYLIEEKGYSASKISDLLYNKSGLLGLSGISCDMRDLINKNTARTNEAINYFCYRICRELGSLVAALGGIDVLVFTAGIGENSPLIRQKICETSKWLNIEIDNSLNASQALNINTSNSKVDVLVIPTNEELMIAKETFLHCDSLTFIN
jgi:acetate kinase